MANLPISSYVMKIGPPPYYNRINRHPRHPPLQARPIDKSTVELILQLAPFFRQLKVHSDDFSFVPSNGVMRDNAKDFHINLDVGLYTPKELSAKIINDHVVIEGNHNERKSDDIGYVSRHFVRRYELPKGYNADNIVCKLSSDGVLSVVLPKTKDKPKERILNIHQAGPNDAFLEKNKSVKHKCDKYYTKKEIEKESDEDKDDEDKDDEDKDDEDKDDEKKEDD